MSDKGYSHRKALVLSKDNNQITLFVDNSNVIVNQNSLLIDTYLDIKEGMLVDYFQLEHKGRSETIIY